jgi:hypothetical protein
MVAIASETNTELERSSGPLVASSCASANCHGSADQSAPAWQTAFTTFLAHDPHTQAYNVLFTHRSRVMTRLLTGQQQPLSDDAHQQAIHERCTDCHATATESAASAGLGVQCESCHGPSQQWLHAHDRTVFSRRTAGFIDTKDLTTRAKTCLACHSSHHIPRDENAPVQVVGHDLIAAGHPRLTFDQRTYLESLPAHWDRQADEARHGPAFHFTTWLTGVQQAAAQQTSEPSDQPPDFAQLDCFACHHALTSDSWRQPAKLADLSPPRWPPADLLAIAEMPSLTARAALVSRLVNAAAREQRWDAATSAFQAVEALRADLADSAVDPSALDAAMSNLRKHLASDCFPSEISSRRRPTVYDSPANFNPALLQPHLNAVHSALRDLEAAGGAR